MNERREIFGVTLVMAALSVAATYPLVRQMGSALPGDLGDPLLTTFILGWDADRIRHGLQALWDAPFYFPTAGALTLSEHLLGIAVFTAPIQWLTGNAVLAYNLAFLGSIVLSGVGGYLLTRFLWGRRDAAWLGALAFAFAPHRAMQVGHLQVLVCGWMPIALWALHRYFATWSRRAMAAFALAFALQALSNLYYMLFFSLAVAGLGAAELGRFLRARTARGADPAPSVARVAVDLGFAAAAIGAALVPVLLAYRRSLGGAGFHRTLREMINFSAVAGDYLRIPAGLWAWSGRLSAGAAERALYPGVIAAALAVLGLLSFARSDATGERIGRWRWYVGLYAALLVFSVWMTLGPGVTGPYTVLLTLVPGLDGLRVPARFVVMVALALAVLGSAGAAWVLARLRPRVALVAAAVVGAAIVADGYGGPLTMVPFDPWQADRSELNAWVRSGPDGGVLELPIVPFAFAPVSLAYQYNTLLHRHPVVNGYAGRGSAFQDYLGDFASPFRQRDEVGDALQGLRALNVRFVILHRDVASRRPELRWTEPDLLAEAIDRAAGMVEEKRQFGEAVAWRLAPPVPSSSLDTRGLVALAAGAIRATASANPDLVRFAFDGNIDTRWHSGRPQDGSEWMRLDFDRDIDIGRLVFTTPPAGIGNHPRDLVVESQSADGSTTVLRSGSVMPGLIRSLAAGTDGSPVVLDLPRNQTRTLWLRQRGRTTSWYWTVPELTVFERPR
jgi:hypothetical protein